MLLFPKESSSCDITKMRKFLPTFRVSLKISWEPGSLAPGEYPTLDTGMVVLVATIQNLNLIVQHLYADCTYILLTRASASLLFSVLEVEMKTECDEFYT